MPCWAVAHLAPEEVASFHLGDGHRAKEAKAMGHLRMAICKFCKILIQFILCYSLNI
jgi:hypothetical protein